MQVGDYAIFTVEFGDRMFKQLTGSIVQIVGVNPNVDYLYEVHLLMVKPKHPWGKTVNVQESELTVISEKVANFILKLQ